MKPLPLIPSALVLYCLVMSLGACSTHVAVIDSAEVDEAQLAADRRECEHYADELDDDGHVAESMLVSAFFMGLTEYIFSGGNEDFAREAALVGAIEGGIIGASDLAYEKSEIVKNCLHERGYIVLN